MDLEETADAPSKTDEKLDFIIQLMRGTQENQALQEQRLAEVETQVKNNNGRIEDLTKRVTNIEDNSQFSSFLMKEQANSEKNIVVRHETALTTAAFNSMLEEKGIGTRIRELQQVGNKEARLKLHIGKLDSALMRNQLLYEIGSKLDNGMYVSRDIPKVYKELHQEFNRKAKKMREMYTNEITKKSSIRTKIDFEGTKLVLSAKQSGQDSQYFKVLEGIPKKNDNISKPPSTGPLGTGEREVLGRSVILAGRIERAIINVEFERLMGITTQEAGLIHVEAVGLHTKCIFNRKQQAAEAFQTVNGKKLRNGEFLIAEYLDLPTGGNGPDSHQEEDTFESMT